MHIHHTTTITILRPFFRDHPGEPVPEENFWTVWCKGRLTEADTPTIRLGATPSGLTSANLHNPPIFYRPDALPATQPTVSKHWRQHAYSSYHYCKTEFLLIGLEKQLTKKQNSSVSITHSAHNLGFIFDKHITLSTNLIPLQILLLSYSSTLLHLTLFWFQNSQ